MSRKANRGVIPCTKSPKIQTGFIVAHFKRNRSAIMSRQHRSVAMSRFCSLLPSRLCFLIPPPSKYLDSHLRPFVCTHSGCNSPQFSSNACLFRHQREAHGLHGHGENPHLCYFPGCERAQDRNGFPRKWNLKDHMKRVHGWEESDDSLSSGSQPAVPQKPGNNTRKRKGNSPITSVQMKRQSSSQAKARAASISFLQSSQQHQHAVDQAYPVTAKWPESGRQHGFAYQGNFNLMAAANSHRMQTGAYQQQFGQSQEYFTSEGRYPF
jgi:hypothetical protein